MEAFTNNITEEQLKAQAAQAIAGAKIKLPSKKEVVGVLLSAEEIESKGSSIVLVSIQDVDDNVITLSTSPGYWKKIGKLFPVDTIVKVSYEARIKGVTGYESNGAMVAHTSDGNNLVGVNRFSSLSFQRMLDGKDKDSDIAVISAVEVDRVSAVAQYLAAYVSKR